MELLQLQYFLETAKHGSMTKAAESLYVSQPSLSQTIRRLEKELGTRLFERHGRNIVLTSKGRKFYDAVYLSMMSLEKAREDLTHETLQGHIRIGSYMPIHIILPCIHQFADQHPDVKFTFLSIVNSYSTLPENLDILLLYEHSNALNFNQRMKIGSVDAALVVPTGRSPEELAAVTIEDVEDGDFISLVQNDYYEEYYYNFFHKGKIPNIRYLTNSRSYKEELLEEGLGIGFTNRLLTNEFRKTGKYDVVSSQNIDGLYNPNIYLAWRGDHYLQPAAKALKDFMKEWFGKKEQV